MLTGEDIFYKENYKLIVGLDEAGRGPLCGPVVAAACILPINFNSDLIDDSKKLSEKKREEAYLLIKENAIAYGVGIIDAKEIDKINIYEASRKAMLEAIKNMNHDFDLIITDAMPLTYDNYIARAFIKGDATYKSIAAASIIAKVTRDHLMNEYDKLYPQYDLKHNKGYGTKKHLEALKKYGPIKDFHRFSYKPVLEAYNNDLELNFDK